MKKGQPVHRFSPNGDCKRGRCHLLIGPISFSVFFSRSEKLVPIVLQFYRVKVRLQTSSSYAYSFFPSFSHGNICEGCSKLILTVSTVLTHLARSFSPLILKDIALTLPHSSCFYFFLSSRSFHHFHAVFMVERNSTKYLILDFYKSFVVRSNCGFR